MYKLVFTVSVCTTLLLSAGAHLYPKTFDNIQCDAAMAGGAIASTIAGLGILYEDNHHDNC